VVPLGLTARDPCGMPPAFREKLRLEAAGWFHSGDGNVIIARVVGVAGLG